MCGRAPLGLLAALSAALPAIFAVVTVVLLAALLPATVEGQGDPGEPCSGGGYDPTPVEVAVKAVPIVVDSTTTEYFVLYVRHELDADTVVELPVAVTLGEEGTTTLAENVAALPKERHRVEKYLVADPADVDGDCIDDITELADPVGLNPVNPAAADERIRGGVQPSYTVVLTSRPTAASVAVTEGALPHVWLNPTASDPAAAVRSAATYTVTFQGNWTTDSTPGGVVAGAHFTTLIGAVHNEMVTFWESRGAATPGVENVAELGVTSTFESEIKADSNAISVIKNSVSGGGAGSATFDVTVTTEHPRVTLLSMIGPSPDWFVGVSGRSLLDAQGEWESLLEVDLFPYDAGTEEGTEFSLNNQATSPRGVITSIRGTGKFSNVRMARLTFTRQSVNSGPSFSSGTSFEVEENRTAAATVVAADPDSGDGVAYAITGGADGSKFNIGETTGMLTFEVPPDYERAADVASTDPLNDAGNNEHIVVVTATGGTGDRALTAEQTITVTVTDVDEPPEAPEAPMVRVASSTSLDVTWTAPPPSRSRSPSPGSRPTRRRRSSSPSPSPS